MPNHVHFIVKIDNDYGTESGAMWTSPPTQPLSQLVRSFKILVTIEIGFSPWQRNYYDHIIRNDNELSVIWNYIECNPENWENDELFSKE